MNKKELAEQITPEKALSNLWRQKQSELIDKHIIPMYATLRAQSISYFLKDGTVSGSFRQALEDIMNDVRKFIAPQPAGMGKGDRFEEGFELACKMLDEMYAHTSSHPYNIADCLRAKRNKLSTDKIRKTQSAVEAMGKPEAEANHNPNIHNLDITYTGVCRKCGGTNLMDAPSPTRVEAIGVQPEGRSEGDLVASSSNTDDASLASHSCTDGNSIEQVYREALEKISLLYHTDRSCSLEAQGYNEQECQQIGIDDHAAQIAIQALTTNKKI